MARKIDPAITTIMKSYGLDSATALWDCHGTWVMYHRSLEQVAADQKIKFDPPLILEANGATKSVAICVTGHFKDRAEWSIGEAAPGNNKNAYPYAMAEKRAKDRVILKLIGLHGLVYSEEEMQDERKPAPTVAEAEPEDESKTRFKAETLATIKVFKDAKALSDWWNSDDQKAARRAHELTQDEIDVLKSTVMAKIEAVKPRRAA